MFLPIIVGNGCVMLEQRKNKNARSGVAAPRQALKQQIGWRDVGGDCRKLLQAELAQKYTRESSDKFPMRDMPRDIQEIAFAKGIPYIPADRKDRS